MTTQALTAERVASHLGLHRYPRSWRGECPACAYASTFSLKAGKGGRAQFFCASCRDPDAIRAAVQKRLGMPASPADPVVAEDAAAARQKRLEAAGRCWRGAEPISRSPGAAYLVARGIGQISASPALKWRRDVSHPECRGNWCAMVSEVVDDAGEFVGIHRTYLEGLRKARVFPDKASLGGIWGGSVRLAEPLDDPAMPQLVIGEGIESSASAGLLLGLPAWAALSAGNLAQGLILPPDIRNIVVAADNDVPGREAADAALQRWVAEGRIVQIAVPDLPGYDFNDVLLERANG